MLLRLSLPTMCLGLGLATVAPAQNLTSRLSDVRYNATYGGGSSVSTPNDLVTSTALDATGSVALPFSASGGGYVNFNPMRPWGASVSTDQSHRYEVIGALTQFKSIAAQGKTQVQAAATGEGLATIVASNELTLAFTLAGTQKMRLAGMASLIPDGQNLASSVALQRWDGIVWANVFNSLFLAGQEGTFDTEMDLIAGSYRITGASSGNAFAGVRPSQENEWSYTLTTVPEPATMATLALGALAALRKRRR